MKTANEIFGEFENLLEEVLKTHGELSGSKSATAFRLLFAHLVNGFDSLINELRIITLSENLSAIRNEAKKQDAYNRSPSFKELLDIEDNGGIYNYLAKDLIENLRETYSKMKHYQKVQQLTGWLEIKQDYFLAVLGCSAGKITEVKPSTSSAHYKTQSYKMMGYIDVTFEKRNAITHNKNKLPKHVRDRLNKKWKLEIKKEEIGVNKNSLRITAVFYRDFMNLLREKIITSLPAASQSPAVSPEATDI